MRYLILIYLVLAACATPAKSQSPLDGLDTFGSQRINASAIKSRYGGEINEMAEKNLARSNDFFHLKLKIAEEIKNQYGFAFVDLSLITYFEPNPGNYLTVDVVELQDAGRRMNFLPQPKGRFTDPDGLIALWDQYFEVAFQLQRSGQFQYPKSCPAWHCTHGFENEKLTPFLQKFEMLVPRNEKKLVEILNHDSRAAFRANAMFLLAHIKDGRAVIRYALSAVNDSVGLVRNNAVRVLSEIAEKHPEMKIPLQPILEVLDFPEATDRNKAGYVLAALSLKDENKKIIRESVGNILLEMLKLQQPNNHDPAYSILKNISGKSFGERDYAAWENWLRAGN